MFQTVNYTKAWKIQMPISILSFHCLYSTLWQSGWHDHYFIPFLLPTTTN